MNQCGFAISEYQSRTKRAQRAMADHGISAILLTTAPEFAYFSGYQTRFWESPSRPWFMIIPASGKPVAVIPSIGHELMAQTWVDDIRTWVSPDLNDDGISLLCETLREFAPSGRIAIPSGHESHLRMPLNDYHRMIASIGADRFGDDANITRSLRMVKSDAEIAKIKTACDIAGRAFARVPEIAHRGRSHDMVCREFQRLCLAEGADCVPYLASGLGPSGYSDVISLPSARELSDGDILMLDTGVTWDGYFADFDRNYSVGKPDPKTSDAFSRLQDAVDAGLATARIGATCADVFHAMVKVTGGGKAAQAGRFGHGLGLQLTEWPSLIAAENLPLVDGMVLTLEPSIETTQGRILVHEENIVIRETGAEMLSPRAPANMVVI
ncbi:peptidase M24 [Amylibacter kogurei]|uniref:Peptidase M24 n=1 Tax=Paramylibacter kogurei TaxID=1889778 RepID=A0A2G5K5F0_9RHOB|nr:Xaa-Pro peptidase family protein [Amylibacter kogurei]PIB24262.1 peptidase M24 [Amylibacter kogurei]